VRAVSLGATAALLLSAGVCLAAPATTQGALVASADDSEDAPRLWTQRPRPRGLSYGGRVFSTVAPDLRMEGDYEDRFAWRTGVDFRVKYRFADSAYFRVGTRFRYELRVGDRTEADVWLDPGEAYLQFRKGRFSARLGRVLLSWGRNPLLSPLGILNPLDLQGALASAGEDSPRIPVLGARLKLGLHPLAIEAVYLPFFQPTRFSLYGRDFSALRPGLLEGLLSGSVPGTGIGVADDLIRQGAQRLVDILTELDPYARDGLQSYLVSDLPEEFPWHGDLGLRLGLTGMGVEGDLVVLWHILDRPEFRIHEALRRPLLERRLPDTGEWTRLTNPGAEPVSTVYHRSLMVGGDVSLAKGGFVVTAEGAVHTKAIYYSKSLESYLSPRVHYAAAVRYTFGTVFAIDAEFAHDIILEPVEDPLLQKPHDVRLALLGTLRLFRDKLQILVSGTYNFAQRDLYLQPQVTIEADDRVSLRFGVAIFEGFRNDPEPNLDSLLAYQGGAFGLFRGNDYAYGTLTLRF